MSILKTIKDRWNSETPKFFRQIRKLVVALGSSATAVWIANSSMGLNLDDIVLIVCKYTITFCAAMGLTAQLTAVDPPENKP